MTSSEKFCLKWNDFQDNIANSFHGLREDLDFSDVTLVCEEDHQIEAHRVILSACSPFFSSVLKRNKHSHPMIYMRGIKSKDLVAIVNFIYHGEVNIYQEDLDGFLSIAEELQLKGLTGTSKENIEERRDTISLKPDKKLILKKESSLYMQEQTEIIPKQFIHNADNDGFEENSIVPVELNRVITNVESNNEELQSKIASMMTSINDGEGNKWMCTVCEKTSKLKGDIKRHVESHIEGVSHTCGLCGKVSRSSMGFVLHMSRDHKH